MAEVPLTYEQMDKAMKRIGELMTDRDKWREAARKSADEVIRLRLLVKDSVLDGQKR